MSRNFDQAYAISAGRLTNDQVAVLAIACDAGISAKLTPRHEKPVRWLSGLLTLFLPRVIKGRTVAVSESDIKQFSATLQNEQYLLRPCEAKWAIDTWVCSKSLQTDSPKKDKVSEPEGPGAIRTIAAAIGGFGGALLACLLPGELTAAQLCGSLAGGLIGGALGGFSARKDDRSVFNVISGFICAIWAATVFTLISFDTSTTVLLWCDRWGILVTFVGTALGASGRLGDIGKILCRPVIPFILLGALFTWIGGMIGLTLYLCLHVGIAFVGFLFAEEFWRDEDPDVWDGRRRSAWFFARLGFLLYGSFCCSFGDLGDHRNDIRHFDGYDGCATTLAVSPNGRLFAGGGSKDHPVGVWDVSTGNRIRFLDVRDCTVISVSVALGGRRVLIGGKGKNPLQLIDIEADVSAYSLKIPGVPDDWQPDVLATAISPDGSLAVSAGNSCEIHLWDVEKRIYLRRLGMHENVVHTVAFSPDGQFIVTGAGNWKRDAKNNVVIQDDNPIPIDCTLRLWEVKTGKEVHVFHGHKSKINCVAFSPDGRYLLSGDGDEYEKNGVTWYWLPTLRLWDVSSGLELRRFEGHTRTIRGVVFSSDGHRLLSSAGDDDKTVRLWDVETAHELRRFRSALLTNGVFSPDGHHAIFQSEIGAFTPSLQMWKLPQIEK